MVHLGAKMGSKRHLIWVSKKSFEIVLRVARGGDRGKFSKRLADFPPSPIVCKLKSFLHDFQKLVLQMWPKFAAKMVPRRRQDGSKKALLDLILAHLGVLWRHVGSLVQYLSPSCRYDTLDWREDAPT